MSKLTDLVDKIAEATPPGTEFLCSYCSRSTADGNRLVDLLEHCAFDHASRADLLTVRTEILLTGYDVGSALALHTQSEAEEKWRRAQLDELFAEARMPAGTSPAPATHTTMADVFASRPRFVGEVL